MSGITTPRAGMTRALALGVLALGGALAATPVQAADPVHGSTVYRGASPMACTSCHGTNIAANQNKIKNGANNASRIQSAINGGTGGMDVYISTLTATDVADIAAYLAAQLGGYASLSATSLSYASTAVGASSTQSVTLTNNGVAALSITSITVSGTHAADYVVTGSSTCSAGASVAAGGSCSVQVAFGPSAAGVRSATLNIAQSATAPSTTVSVSLTGTAAAPALQLSSTSLNFGSATLGTTTATQTLTLTNSGAVPLSLSSIASGSSEFAVTSGGTCSMSASVAAGGSCTVALNFTPGIAGARSATLSIASNAPGSPTAVALAGTGLATSPAISVSPAALTFSQTVGSTSAAQNVTISNSGTAALSLAGLSLTGAAATDYALAGGGTCSVGGSVAAGGSCVVRITFTPAASGTRSAALSIAHNATGSPSSVTLSGTGTAAPQPAISLNATSLTFPATVVGSTSAAQSVTITNSGTASLTLSGLTLSGTSASNFTRGGTCSTSASLAAGATCSVTLSFTPSATGSRTATLTLVSNASNGTATLALSGTGNPVPAPVATLSATTLNFASQMLGTSSGVQTVTLSNTGSAALTLGSITLGGGNPADFAKAGTCVAGASVAAGGSCTLSVTFTPTATGARSAILSVAHNASGSPSAITLAGTGSAVPLPTAAWVGGGSALSFGTASVGGAATTQVIALVNNGPGMISLSQFNFSGAQASEFAVHGGTCTVGASLAAGYSCTFTLAFQPGAAGARSASLNVLTSGTDPATLLLSGTGSAPSIATAGPSAAHGLQIYNGSVQPACASCHGTDLSRNMNRILNGSNPAVISNAIAANMGGMAVYASKLSTPDVADLAAYIANPTATVQSAGSSSVVTVQSVDATQNAGAGGCSIGRPDQATDPVWPLLLLGAGVALRRRRSRAARPMPSPF